MCATRGGFAIYIPGSTLSFMRYPILLLLSAAALAQVNGTPASVSSLAPSHTPQAPMVFRGTPASVTSLGPQGFTPHITPEPRHPRHPSGPRVPVYLPVYYSYPYPSYYDSQPRERVVERVVEREAPPQKVEIVIVDKRAEEKKAEAQADELRKAAEPKQSKLSEPPELPAIFVFKDGSRKQLANFAMMAGNLYDLSDGRMVRIALTTLDREATVAANAKAGRDIQLP